MTSDSVVDYWLDLFVNSVFNDDSHSDSVFYSLLRSYWLCEVYYVRLLFVLSLPL